jgi:hypothetical protein
MRSDASSAYVCKGLRGQVPCTETRLIEAHVIPQGFARAIRATSKHNLAITTEGVKKAKIPLGIFDRTILCSSCDQVLGIYDDYALQVCRNYSDSTTIQMATAFEMPNIDGDQFAKFILAVLWRASTSGQRDYEEIRLGQRYENEARDVLFGQKSLAEMRAFQVLVRRFRSVEGFNTTLFYSLPKLTKFGVHRAYGFSLGGFQIIAKMDSRPWPATFRPWIVNGNSVLRGLLVEFKETGDFEMMMQSYHTQQARTIIHK